ncbi:hypothetical protein EWM64_g3774 [Hericium alpestre]|uniref:Fungal-type protein kinase domain-containing protein n=1 Tax=Hericium alpestre TaxID=135208 RepID=A0A4Y9ZZC7_9AGAM|nr:hypothetical protein EWM64_g3774 [Hericium alpestre]
MNYPLVLECTARPLKDFKSSRELCTSIRDTVEAHGDVYVKTGILHRDVSAVNILIADGGKGQLIDSDSCIRVTPETSRCHWRTGTWQFTAGQILRHPGTQHEFRHDLESFFHVLYYHVMRYCRNPSGTLASDILKVYDSCCWDSAHKSLYGGQEKIATFGGRYLDPQELYGQLTPSFVELLLDLDEHFLNTYIAKGSRFYNEASSSASFTLLANSEGVLAIFDKHLKEDDWPTDDASYDNILERAKKCTYKLESIACFRDLLQQTYKAVVGRHHVCRDWLLPRLLPDFTYTVPPAFHVDVDNQIALTQGFKAPHAKCPFILDCVGRPMHSFSSSRELCTSIRDAVEAHGAVYEKTGVLHRDMSGATILIVDGGMGQLIDWDFCKPATRGTSRCYWRTGTWQFAAAAIQEHPGTSYEFRHDLESFFHVLLFHVLRYSRNSLPTLEFSMLEVFDSCRWDCVTEALVGGVEKLSVFDGRFFSARDLRSQFKPSLVGIIQDFRAQFRNAYADEDTRHYNEAETKASLAFLSNAKGVIAVFDKYLGESDWPADDAGYDNIAESAKERARSGRTVLTTA